MAKYLNILAEGVNAQGEKITNGRVELEIVALRLQKALPSSLRVVVCDNGYIEFRQTGLFSFMPDRTVAILYPNYKSGILELTFVDPVEAIIQATREINNV